MSKRIGVLLPRSVEYPSISFDLLDGLRLYLKGKGDYQFFTENTGFGEDADLTNASAEKLVLQHDVDLIIAYSTSLNAETLYSFAETANKPILFLDAGMEIFEAPPHRLCRHLTLQGLMACQVLGEQAGEQAQKIISAASFFDGGYRSSWVFHNAIVKKGGAFVGHFVSQFKEDEFTITPLLDLIRENDAEAVTAAFSSYFDGLFMNALKQTDVSLRNIPFYCAPFMADEQLLSAIPFPAGNFLTAVPWALTIDTEANRIFKDTLQTEKNKTANIFHLLGWEAGIVAAQILTNGIAAADDWSFESPRGNVRFHPQTHNAYAPLYLGKITDSGDGKCKLVIEGIHEVTAEQHKELYFARPEGSYSRWKNNYFCI